MRYLISSLAFFAGLQLASAQGLDSLINDGSKEGAVEAKSVVYSTWAANIQKHIKNLSADQNAFLRALEGGQWDQATLLFTKAFEGTAFQRSSYGQSLQTLVMFKTGLHTVALEKLFQVSRPQEMEELRKEWIQAAPEGFYAWDLVKIQWHPEWTAIFGKEVEYQVKAQAIQDMDSIEVLKKLSQEAPAGSLAKARIDWKLVLTYSLNDKADEAAKLLVQLMKHPKAPVSQDLMQLTAARLLYQNGYFDAAIRYYEKIPKASELWIEAQEEIAWSYLRKGQPQNALAITRGLDSSVFANQVRPEAFLVNSVAGLKVCDYPEVVKTLEKFPKSFKARTRNLEALTKNETSNDGMDAAIALLKVRKIRIQDLGKNSDLLPRMTARDSKLYNDAQAIQQYENEAKTAEQLYAKSLATTGLQAYFEDLNRSLQNKAQAAKSAGISRLKQLATLEVSETKDVLRKMHIVEAEVVQQVALADTMTKNTAAREIKEKAGTTGSKSGEILQFAANDEIWMDEISNYKVDVKKACHAKR